MRDIKKRKIVEKIGILLSIVCVLIVFNVGKNSKASL